MSVVFWILIFGLFLHGWWIDDYLTCVISFLIATNRTDIEQQK